MTTKSNPADEMFWHIVSFESTAYTIGAWLGALATGFLVRWSASYVSKNNGDSRWLKGIAVALAVISVFSSACELAAVLVMEKMERRGIPGPNHLLPPPTAGVNFGSVASGILCQSYFGHLVYKMLKTSFPHRLYFAYVWIAFFGIMILGAATIGLACVGLTLRLDHYWVPEYDTIDLRGWPIHLYIAWLALTAAVDLTLATVLVVRFLRSVHKDGFRHTNSLLVGFAKTTLETFSLTATLAIANLVLSLVFSEGKASVTDGWKMDASLYVMLIMIQRAYAMSFLFTRSRHTAFRRASVVSLPYTSDPIAVTGLPTAPSYASYCIRRDSAHNLAGGVQVRTQMESVTEGDDGRKSAISPGLESDEEKQLGLSRDFV